MSADLDYLAHLARDSDRFADLLLEADPMQPVPSCPDWTTVDLLWHLTEVQWFWGTVVRERVADPSALPAAPPERPTDLDSLGHVFATVSAGLEDALGAATPETPVWTWADDHTVGWVRRRQAHEALIHRVDAELATGGVTDIDPELATDGVDEVLRVMYGGVPGWATFERGAGTVRIESSDTGASWTVALGRVSGTDPESGESVDEAGLVVADDDPATADATVRGSAADLDCWLWNRLAADRVDRSGDEDVLARLQSVLDQGID
ncbi:MAG: maleylpyruvate isomerase family mycothiol-dependent enzyme [Actinomycetota bacterium]|nr:maleylpyruvate isomerase family mycothiol-dependent enzyme [Actinomycetota bacterium]